MKCERNYNDVSVALRWCTWYSHWCIPIRRQILQQHPISGYLFIFSLIFNCFIEPICQRLCVCNRNSSVTTKKANFDLVLQLSHLQWCSAAYTVIWRIYFCQNVWPWMISKRDSRFYVADLYEIRSVIIYCILSLQPYQLPITVSNETTRCFHTHIDRNLQRYRVVSLRRHGFLVKKLSQGCVAKCLRSFCCDIYWGYVPVIELYNNLIIIWLIVSININYLITQLAN